VSSRRTIGATPFRGGGDRRRCCWYYLWFPDNGEHGAVDLSESEEALSEFGQSEVARTIPEVYPVQGSPVGETAEVIMLPGLSPDRGTASRQSDAASPFV
jgi:hypothetical protein